MSTSLNLDVQVTPGKSQAQQIAASELAKSKYHNQPAQGSVTTMPTIAAPTPPPPPPPSQSATKASDPTVILVIVGAIVLALILVFVLRAIGKPRGEKKPKKKKKPKTGPSTTAAPAFDEVLAGAALHRRTAEQSAAARQWAEAIRERFRAVIATLDERGLLPERPERTADEAARDAGEVLPEHRAALSDAARAFDEVEYGEYLGSAEGYAGIREVDEQVAAAPARTRGLPAVRR
jgi:hypothetical protein